MANITKRTTKDGQTHYRIRVLSGTDRQGKQVFTSTTYTPKATSPKAIEKEVQRFADDFEARAKNGLYIEGDKITLNDFIPVWDENWAKDHLTVAVRDEYNYLLNLRIIPRLGGMKLSKINAPMIESILYGMRSEGRAIKTINKTFTVINSVMKYAFRKGILEENPCQRVELPSLRANKMDKAESMNNIRLFDIDQAKTFLRALELQYPKKVGGRTRKDSNGKAYSVRPYTTFTTVPTQFKVYFTIAIYSGFRRGEMIALTWEDINFKDQTIDINKAFARSRFKGQFVKSPKTFSGFREIKLPSECFNILHRWKTEQREEALKLGTYWKGKTGRDFDKNNIFIQSDGTPMNLCTPYHKFEAILKAYNEMTREKIAKGEASENDLLPVITLHDLRHTSASILIASGVDPVTVAHRLGHKDVSVTLNTYSHFLKKMDDTASDALESKLG